MQSKIGIIGLGAIGSAIAKALFEKEENELSFYTRTRKTEIKIEQDSKRFVYPIECNKEFNLEEKFDWVIICLKAHQFTAAHHLFKQVIGTQTKVAIIRNGINLKEDLLPFANEERILPCMIDCPVQPLENGYYWQFRNPIITLPLSVLCNDFEKLFTQDSATISHSSDFKSESWKKLIESASIGALQCIKSSTCKIFHDKKIMSLYGLLLEEGIKVAISDGAKIDHNYKEYLMHKVLQYPLEKGSSMLTDLKEGNPLELEAKTGAIIKVAKANGIPAPLTEEFCSILAKINIS